MEPVLQVKQQIIHGEYVPELLFRDEEDLVLFFGKWNTTIVDSTLLIFIT